MLKTIIFYIAFLPTFMDLSVLGVSDLIVISTITLFALMNGLLFISYSAYSARRVLTTNKSVSILNEREVYFLTMVIFISSIFYLKKRNFLGIEKIILYYRN